MKDRLIDLALNHEPLAIGISGFSRRLGKPVEGITDGFMDFSID